MSRCVVVGGPGGRAGTVQAALAALGAAAVSITATDAEAVLADLVRAGDDCDLLVLLGEAGDAAVAAAGWAADRRAAAPGGRPRPLVLLAPGASAGIAEPVWRATDVAVLARAEAAAVSGLQVDDSLAAEDAAVAVLHRGPAVAVVDLAAEGAVVARAGRATYLPPFSVEVVDPAGTAECFCAALGVAMVEGLDNFAAAGYASAAAAVSAGRHGAAESMPSRDDVDRMAHSVDLRRDPGTLPVEYPR